MPLGICIGVSASARRALRPTIEFLRAVPGVALIPLVLLLYGQSPRSDVALAAFGAVWPMVMQSMYGVREVSDVAMQTARAFGLTRGQRLLWVTLPSALPFVATGLRLASAIALIVAVSTEIVIGTPGLGYAITVARSAGALTTMYALILASGCLGVLIHVLFTRLEAHFLRWHESQR